MVCEAKACTRGRPKCVPDDVQSNIIVNCAWRLFLKKGYGATTTDDIAAACKISKQTLYRLFPAKSALFSAVVSARTWKCLDLPRDDDDLPLAETLARIFMIDMSEEADRERVEILRLVIIEGGNFPELSDILKRQGIELARADLADWLTRQCARGRIKAGDMTALAQLLMDMALGAIVLRNISNLEWPSPEQRRAHIRNCIDVFLHGVCPENKLG
jgi:TetR/AcrR family transcriptional regulator, mexJK operon transcriptional repressor